MEYHVFVMNPVAMVSIQDGKEQTDELVLKNSSGLQRPRRSIDDLLLALQSLTT